MFYLCESVVFPCLLTFFFLAVFPCLCGFVVFPCLCGFPSLFFCWLVFLCVSSAHALGTNGLHALLSQAVFLYSGVWRRTYAWVKSMENDIYPCGLFICVDHIFLRLTGDRILVKGYLLYSLVIAYLVGFSCLTMLV